MFAGKHQRGTRKPKTELTLFQSVEKKKANMANYGASQDEVITKSLTYFIAKHMIRIVERPGFKALMETVSSKYIMTASKCMDGLSRRASSDPDLQHCAAESESAVHDGRTGLKGESQTWIHNTHTHISTHTKASRGGMFCSSALHLFIAKYNQRNPGLPLPPLCVNS